MERYNNTIQDSNGDIITGASVTVYLSSSGAVASIFKNDETTALNNPFTVSDSNYDTDGSFWFKAANALYDIKVVNGSDTSWKYGETLFDYDDRTNVNLKVDGILFGSDTAAANTLDDYEEDAWTPGLSFSTGSITYSNRLGRYTKVGNLITCNFWISVSSTSTPSGSMTLTGLPYATGPTSTRPATVLRAHNLTGVTGLIGIWSAPSATTATVITMNNGSTSNTDASVMQGSSELDGTFSYVIS